MPSISSSPQEERGGGSVSLITGPQGQEVYLVTCRIPRVLEITIPPLYIVMSHNPLYTWEADSGGCTQ